jgi:hypothetical protein
MRFRAECGEGRATRKSKIFYDDVMVRPEAMIMEADRWLK